MSEPLLSVRDLAVTYPGGVPAVRGVSFDLDGGRDARSRRRVRVRQVDDRGGAAAPAPTRHQGDRRGAPRRGGRADDAAGAVARRALEGDVDRLPGRAAHAQPGAAHRLADRGGDHAPPTVDREARATRARGRAARRGGHPARSGRRLPAPALRRAEAAGAHRPRACVRPAPADRRRADDRARRDGAGAGAAAPGGAAARSRAGDAVHHPRPVDAGQRLPAPRGHVRRAVRRGGRRARRVRRAGPPVHDGAVGGVSGDRRPPLPDGALRARGRPTRPA